MAALEFKDISFEEKNNKIRIIFLGIFYTDIAKKELEKIGIFNIKKNSITFPTISQTKANNKFNFLLLNAFKTLKNKLTNQQAIYIHKNSEIPLIGNNAFVILT